MNLCDAVLAPAGLTAARVLDRVPEQPLYEREDWLAQEQPVALVINGISQAVMLVTPTALEDFARGFLFTEGLVEHPSQVYGVDERHQAEGIVLDVEVACAWRLRERRRIMAGRTGCGLCGTTELKTVRRQLAAVPTQRVSAAELVDAMRKMQQRQLLQQWTGATHAAAWCLRRGGLVLLREDVGRHNALDKLVGALVQRGFDAADGYFCISSRASFEMVQKTAAAGVGLLAAASAPTALAVSCAAELNVALAGFVRDQRVVAYTFAERFAQDSDA